MTDFAFTINAERWNNEVILQGSVANMDTGNQTHNGTLPPGLGDVAIMELQIDISSIETLVANPEMRGVEVLIVHPAGAVFDLIGVERWQLVQTAQVAAYISPDPLVQWKQGEELEISFGTIDTGAADTSDMTVRVKVVRVPVTSQEVRRPIRLVR